VEEAAQGIETELVRQFKQAQKENGRLKQMLAELTLEKTKPQDARLSIAVRSDHAITPRLSATSELEAWALASVLHLD
jgi:hypothetical protein